MGVVPDLADGLCDIPEERSTSRANTCRKPDGARKRGIGRATLQLCECGLCSCGVSILSSVEVTEEFEMMRDQTTVGYSQVSCKTDVRHS